MSTTAECPRCGYDQRGLIETWADRCPLESNCTECGLRFQWADLFTAETPRWCVEFPRTLMGFYGRAAKTLARSFLPWLFWRDLQMWHPCRWPMLVNYVLLGLFLVYVLFSVCHGLVVLARWGVPGAGNFVSWGDIFRSMVLPLSPARPAIPLPGRTMTSLAICRQVWFPLQWLGVPLMVHVFCPAVFLTLPQSRRLARVRWRHIFRVAVYGVALLAPLLVIHLVGATLHYQRSPAVSRWGGSVLELIPLATGLWLLLELGWWWMATRRYLHMRHALGVAVAVLIIATLSSIAVIFWAFIR